MTSYEFDAVVIPSYARATTIAQDSVATLIDGGIPPEAITVFAGCPDGQVENTLRAYRSALPKALTVRGCQVGLDNANNAITDAFPAGTRIVRVDDDLRAIKRLTPDGKLEVVTDLVGFFSQAFRFAAAEYVTLWGLAPTANSMFMKPRWRTGLAFALGQVVGIVNVPTIRGTLRAKDDYERTLQHYTHAGAVGRIDDHVAITKAMRTYKGGLQAECSDRRARELDEVGDLMRRWPALVHPAKVRDGFQEIALRLPTQAQRAG